MNDRSLPGGLQHRWMIRADVPEVVALDARAADVGAILQPWSESDLREVLQQRRMMGFVALQAELVVGYCVYRIYPDALAVCRLVVDHARRRQGVGQFILSRLARRLLSPRMKQIVTVVPERELGSQLFLRACGFRCQQVNPDFWQGDSGYVFALRAPIRIQSPLEAA